MITALALPLLASLALPFQGENGAVRGRVRSESTGEPLAGAVVELLGVRGAEPVGTDRAGAYRLSGVPSGRRVLRARHLGFAPLEMEVVVPAGREVELDVALRPTPVPLPALRVQGSGGPPGGADTLAAPRSELARAQTRVLEASPGVAELGLSEVARGTPGQEPPDPADVLYVRGTGADLKLVYLDGAPVYAPFPLGGLLEAFSPNLLRSADIHLGGAPARYDGGLSYVLDLRTRGAHTDRPHVEGAADLLSARILTEAPLGRNSGLLLAGRTVHGLGAGGLISSVLPYGYREGLVRADAGIGGAALLSVTAFGNGEEVWLEEPGSGDGAVRWGNTALSARLRTSLRGTAAEFTAASGDFLARLPFGGRAPALAEGRSRRMRAAADLSRFSDGFALRYGLAYEGQQQSYRRRPRTAAEGWTAVGEPAAADAMGAYVDLGWQVDPRVRVRAGMRADRFSLGPSLRFAPRLSATVLVGERAALTLAGGRYHQYLRPPEGALFAPDSARANVPVAPLALGDASHLAMTLDQELAGGVRLGVEGFFKSFRGVPGSDASEANASGVDVWVRRGEGDWNGWLGYSLAWVWSVGAPQEQSRFAGRQLLSAGLRGPLGERGRLDLGVVYGAGLPYSAIPLAVQDESALTGFHRNAPASSQLSGSAGSPPLLPEPTQPYLRLDLGAAHTWSGTWRGVPVSFSPYFRLLNTLGERDALFYRYDRARDPAPRALMVIPTVPVIGVEWKF